MTKYKITKECNKISSICQNLLSLTNTKNPIDIAQSIGVTIRFVNLTEAFGFVDKGKDIEDSTIYINDELDKYSKKIICAHELGHLFTDTSDAPSLFDTSIDSVSEFYANYFVKCLMPQVFVFAALDKYETFDDFNRYVSSCIHFK